jgi:hypothetical protein
LAVEVEPVVSFVAASLAWRTHITPLPFFAVAAPPMGATTAQAATRQGDTRSTGAEASR